MCKENHKLASDVVIAKEYNKDMLLHCAAASARVEKNRPFAVLCCCAVDCAKHFSYVENSFPFHLLFISGLLCLDSVSFRSLERHCSLIWEISISCLGLIMISFPQWSPLCIPPPKTKKNTSTQQHFYQAVVSVSKSCATQKAGATIWQSSNPRNASNCTSHPRSQQRTGNPGLIEKLVSAINSPRQGPYILRYYKTACIYYI